MSGETGMKRGMLTTGGLLFAAALFFVVNILSDELLQSTRVDLTENQLYTLSQGTRNIIASIDEPVRLRLYLSRQLVTGLPGISSYATRVTELLQEYQRASNGNIQLSIIDPEPFSEAEDRAVGYGLQGVPLDESGAATFYFGLVGTNSVDDEEIIPFFQPDRGEFLEYDVTQLLYKLSDPRQPVVGVLSTIPLESPANMPFGGQGGGQPLVILEQMRQFFQIEMLENDTAAIGDDIDVLMVVHPRDLPERTRYAIDQYVLGGGHTLVFVDPFAESDQAAPNPMMPASTPGNSDLPQLFAQWGIRLATDQVAADMQVAKRVQYARSNRPVFIDYPVWMDMAPEYYDQTDIVTNQLPGVTMASAGIIEILADTGTQVAPLIQTSPEAMKVPTSKLGFMANPQDLVREFSPEGQFMTAVRITGTVKSAFPEGAPGEEGDSEEIATDHLAESRDPANIIVVADTDMLQDRFWVQTQNFLGQRLSIPVAANGNFVINAVDNLAGSSDLISVRNRGSFSRPFTRIKELQQEAEQRFLEKEKQLQDQLRETERKIQDLQRAREDSSQFILSPEQQREIERFREEKIKIRKELRAVQHELNRNIDDLEDWMKFLNIGLMPLLIGLGGLVVAGYQKKRRGRQKSAPQTSGVPTP